jgi:sec-independent protein translocase protein TatC
MQLTKSQSNLNQTNALHFLVELRARLFRSVIVLFLIFAILMYFANNLYTLLALPLLEFLPQGHLIATEIVSPFFVPFKLAFMVSLLLTVPYLLFQIWGFISPALYTHEKRLIWPFILMSGCLFYSGIAFAYFVIFPMLFHFLSRVAPQGVILSPDIGAYLDFTLKLLLVFGALFEIPIAMVLLTSLGIVKHEKFVSLRSYAIVGSFVLGMLLAPPDVLSQTLLAVPIWLLYESGIILSKLAKNAPLRRSA